MFIDYSIVRSARKTIAITVLPDGRVLVRAPRRASLLSIQRFVDRSVPWIRKTREKAAAKAAAAASIPPITPAEVRALADAARMDLPPRVRRYAALMQVRYGRITIRNQVSRWGSCSSKGNLNFNCLLEKCPEFVRDYVVVHELCHRKEMNHSARFWALVARYDPDYKTAVRWLSENGGLLIDAMKKGEAPE